MTATEEKISIMQAYANGKKIQFYHNGYWDDWDFEFEPNWSWGPIKYRVKPELSEKKIIPYENAMEFINDFQKHSGLITVEGEEFLYPSSIRNTLIVCYSIDGPLSISYESLAKLNYVWADNGMPCGKEVSNDN